MVDGDGWWKDAVVLHLVVSDVLSVTAVCDFDVVTAVVGWRTMYDMLLLYTMLLDPLHRCIIVCAGV